MGSSPAENLQQHEGWPTNSNAHQATEHLFRDPLITGATMRGAVTQALQRHLAKHAEDPMGVAAQLQLEVKQVTTLPWHFTSKGALYGPIYGIHVG